MKSEPYNLYLDGEWVSAANTFPDYNPATGEVWADIANATRTETCCAIEAAAAAQADWATLAPAKRASYLLRAADLLEERQQEIVALLTAEGGGTFGKGMHETKSAAAALRAGAAAVYQVKGEILPSELGKVSMLIRQPLGVMAVISPWNFPLLLSLRDAAYVLAVGNTVVLKPSEETPVAGGLLIADLFEAVGLPKGVFNVITCSRDRVDEVGEELVSNPLVRGICFTGSSAVGRKLASLAGQHLKRISLELGGKDALLILDDADLERAVNAATFGAFMHQGQICMAVERILVDENIADEFTEAFVQKVKTLKVGDPQDKACTIGPIINQRQLDKIHSHVTEAIAQGAQVLVGGDYDGLFYQPTVLTDVTPEMRICQEETFGPVAPILRFNNLDEAVALANHSTYGLSAGVITRDEQKGLAVAHQLQTGMVHINDSPINSEPYVPFGGMKSSGIGRRGGQSSIEAFTELRWLTLERGGRHFPPPFAVNGHTG